MMKIHSEHFDRLRKTAFELRKSIVNMLAEAGSGHIAGALGIADIFTALYFHVLNHKNDDPLWNDRDRLVLSCGHVVPVRYAAMAEAGYFQKKELLTLRNFGSRLQGHPEWQRLPGLETTSGPLGSGLSQAIGMAMVSKMESFPWDVYCVMSDGEMQEGNIWEAAMFAGANKLDKVIGIIDRNHIQIDGKTENVMPIDPLAQKWQAFNWRVIEIDGHDFSQILEAFDEAKKTKRYPTIIIANTISGKGIPEIEGDYRWHGAPPGKGPDDIISKEMQQSVFLESLEKTFEKEETIPMI